MLNAVLHFLLSLLRYSIFSNNQSLPALNFLYVFTGAFSTALGLALIARISLPILLICMANPTAIIPPDIDHAI